MSNLFETEIVKDTLIYQNSEITLSNEQFKVVKGILAWLKTAGRSPFIRLNGPAGTGKTILIAYLIQNSIDAFPTNMRQKKIAVCTYTWKAALVLKSRGVEAQSIHSIFYKPIENKVDKNGIVSEGVSFIQRSPAEIREEYSMIIVDEASMVNNFIRRDIEAVGIPVLYVGDENQLPPIQSAKEKSGKEFMEESEFNLLEIRRQALDSPIIRLSMDIREGRYIKYGKHGKGIFKVNGDDITNELLLQSDQLLCGKNITRRFLNKKIRKLKGHNTKMMPSSGESLIGLNNIPTNGLFNGQSWESGQDYSEFSLEYSHKNVMQLISSEKIDGIPLESQITPAWFPEDIKGKSFKNEMQLSAFLQENSVYSVDFGYAITVHKCITRDTYIHTEYGIQQIGELDNGADVGEFKEFESVVKVYNGHELVEVESFYNNGVDELFKITTENGYTLEATKNHTMYVFNSEKGELEAKELRELDLNKDKLLLSSNNEFSTEDIPLKFPNIENIDSREISFSHPKCVNADLALLLGLLTADGFLDRKRIHYTKGSLVLCTLVKRLLTDLFSLPENKVSITKSKKYDFYIVALHSVDICRFFNNFTGLESNNKHVCKLILTSPKTVQQSFLKGVFEDGYVNIKKGKFDHIELTMKDDRMALQIQLMLLNLGIISSKYIRYGKKYANGYINTLFIYSYHAIKFHELINFVDSTKKERLALAKNITYPFGTKGHPISALLLRLLKKYNLSRRLKDNTYIAKGNVSLNVIQKIVNEYGGIDGFSSEADYIFLTQLLTGKFYLQSISKIENIGEKETVCLKMKNIPLFTQNGIVSGNSQGSSYKKPIIFEEWLGNREFHRKWLYTAVTRAEEKLIIVSN